MASSSERTHGRESLTTEEVIEGIFADRDSECADFEHEVQPEDSIN